MHDNINSTVAFALMTRSETTKDPTLAKIAATSMLIVNKCKLLSFNKDQLERKDVLIRFNAENAQESL